jgi:hypothetical protein
MTVESARKWLVVSSLSTTGVMFLFFLLAPAVGFPLLFAQSLRILEVILPVFLGYLGSAASFVFRSSSGADEVGFRKSASSLIGLLIAGPIVIFAVSLLAIILAFGITNRPGAPPGSGISVDQLTAGVSVILGLLVVTTNVAVGYLFGGGDNAKDDSHSTRSADAGTARM